MSLAFSLIIAIVSLFPGADAKTYPGNRQPLEKLVGKVKLSNAVDSGALITIWDGTVFTLVGITRKDLTQLMQDGGSEGNVLFEGFRRGEFFEVVSWEAFRLGIPFFEQLDRPAIIEGEHTALVVRLLVNGLAPNSTQDEIRSEVFGSGSADTWNLNLFEKCSHGQYKVVPFTGRYAGQLDTNGGVMDLDLGNHAETDLLHYEKTASALLPYDGSVDFILFVLPSGGFDWEDKLALATINGRYSMYDDSNILNPFVVGHELGHSLGLKHSADVSDPDHEYGDHTCLMGNGYASDDLRKDFDENTHCFNNAKNWQLGWFADRRARWSPSDGLQTFDLVGVGDYAFTNDKQVVDLEFEVKNGNKYYIGFNRKTGIHSDTKEYEDLVTVSYVEPEPAARISYLSKALDSGDYHVEDDWAIYVESIEIKPEGQPSVARIILGTKSEIIRDNEINNRPMNCVVDKERSAPACTKECGPVPGIPKDGFPAYYGGSCDEHECEMYDGGCMVGGKCGDKAMEYFAEDLKKLGADYVDSDFFCTSIMQIPQYVLSNLTCFASEDYRFLMVSESRTFCTADFSTKAKAGEWKKIKLLLTYEIDGTSKPEIHESSTQFSNTIFAQNIAELLGEDPASVEVNIDRAADRIEVTITTRYHVDLEARVKHRWFLLRLSEKLTHDIVFADLKSLEWVKNDEDEDDDESFFEKNKMILIGAGGGVLVFLIACAICACSQCGSSRKRGRHVKKVVLAGGAVLGV